METSQERLQRQRMEIWENVYNRLLGVATLRKIDPEKVREDFLKWIGETPYAPLEGAEMCTERLVAGLPMPWESEQ